MSGGAYAKRGAESTDPLEGGLYFTLSINACAAAGARTLPSWMT